MTDVICLNEKYSTTRLLSKHDSTLEMKAGDKFESYLFLPKSELSFAEGGLRTQGYFKHSYKDKPLISIVTVVYNGDAFLEESILSVINQNYDNVEYIIIDGGSTDSSLDIIKKYENQVDYWTSEPDKGIYDAMNKGLRKCSLGAFTLCIGADDVLRDINPVVMAIIENTNVDTLICDVTQHNIQTGKNFLYKCSLPTGGVENYFMAFPFHHQGFISRNVKGDNFDLNLGIHADLYFMIHKVRQGQVIKVEREVCFFRTGGASDNFSWKNLFSLYKVAHKLEINFLKLCSKHPFVFSLMIIKTLTPRRFHNVVRMFKGKARFFSNDGCKY